MVHNAHVQAGILNYICSVWCRCVDEAEGSITARSWYIYVVQLEGLHGHAWHVHNVCRKLIQQGFLYLWKYVKVLTICWNISRTLVCGTVHLMYAHGYTFAYMQVCTVHVCKSSGDS